RRQSRSSSLRSPAGRRSSRPPPPRPAPCPRRSRSPRRRPGEGGWTSGSAARSPDRAPAPLASASAPPLLVAASSRAQCREVRVQHPPPLPGRGGPAVSRADEVDLRVLEQGLERLDRLPVLLGVV